MANLELEIDHGAPDHDRMRSHEVDRTPLEVVRQGLKALHANMDSSIETMLDPCAGDGVFGDAAAYVFPGLSRVKCIEMREEERQFLEHFDSVRIGSCLPFEGVRHVDLVATNPPFSIFCDIVEDLIVQHKLAPGGVLMLLGLSSVMQRATDKIELCRIAPPSFEFRIAGPIQFRHGINPKTGKKYGADQRSYSFWVWDTFNRTNTGRAWPCLQLPMLPMAQRKANR